MLAPPYKYAGTQCVCAVSFQSCNARAAAFQVQSFNTELDFRSCRKSLFSQQPADSGNPGGWVEPNACHTPAQRDLICSCFCLIVNFAILQRP